MKALIAVAVVFMSFGLVMGQGFSVGANVGGNYNTLNFDVEGMDAWTGLGFGGGLVFEADFLPMLGAEIDVQYAMYKYGYSEEVLDYTLDMTTTLNNLVIPFLLKYKMAMPMVSPYFVLGPSLIRNLSGTVKVEMDGQSASDDIESEYLETDIGLQVGVGANISAMPPIGIAPYVRYQYNLTADDDNSPNNKESMYDILFGVNFMYKIK
jgi:hypothetical protein